MDYLTDNNTPVLPERLEQLAEVALSLLDTVPESGVPEQHLNAEYV